MAIVQISRIQHRRGLQQDLPNLASAELGWSIDERRLFIGNGTTAEGAPAEGRTEILTEYSDLLSVSQTYTFKNLSAGSAVVTGLDSLHPIARSLQDKLDDYCSVKDFGAVGDGVTDDTAAIQRALDRVYSSSQGIIPTFRHRTVNFPAGNYKVSDTIYVPPYTRIQGEGKRSTIIQGSHAGPIIQFKDGFDQIGSDFGAPDVDENYPEIAEYHFNDISFHHTGTSYDQSTVVIDGCFTTTFQRVMFRGPLSTTSADGGTNYYDTDRGAGVAAVSVPNASSFTAAKNLVFIACDFWEHNYGLELNEETRAVSIQACYFDRLYQGVVAGNNSVYYSPVGISVYDNYFRFTAAEAIKGFADVDQIMSLGNIFTGSGLGDWESLNVSAPSAGYVKSPAITFNADNCYSVSDSFDRDPYYDYPLYPNIETNGYDVYIIGQDRGLVIGDLNQSTGKTVTLEDSATFTQANVTLIGEDSLANLVYKNYTNLAMEYTLDHQNQQRTGSLKISRVGSTYVWDEEYVETGDTGIVFQANTVNGDVEYISPASGNAAVLTYSLKFFS